VNFFVDSEQLMLLNSCSLFIKFMSKKPDNYSIEKKCCWKRWLEKYWVHKFILLL